MAQGRYTLRAEWSWALVRSEKHTMQGTPGVDDKYEDMRQ